MGVLIDKSFIKKIKLKKSKNDFFLYFDFEKKRNSV